MSPHTMTALTAPLARLSGSTSARILSADAKTMVTSACPMMYSTASGPSVSYSGTQYAVCLLHACSQWPSVDHHILNDLLNQPLVNQLDQLRHE